MAFMASSALARDHYSNVGNTNLAMHNGPSNLWWG